MSEQKKVKNKEFSKNIVMKIKMKTPSETLEVFKYLKHKYIKNHKVREISFTKDKRSRKVFILYFDIFEVRIYGLDTKKDDDRTATMKEIMATCGYTSELNPDSSKWFTEYK